MIHRFHYATKGQRMSFIKKPRARRKQLDHTGLRSERCQHNPREQAFAEKWREENDLSRMYGINCGQGYLQDLMVIETGNPDRLNWMFGREMINAEIITQRDARIVATVMQWLGTNCGMGFLSEALAKCGYRIEKKQT